MVFTFDKNKIGGQAEVGAHQGHTSNDVYLLRQVNAYIYIRIYQILNAYLIIFLYKNTEIKIA